MGVELLPCLRYYPRILQGKYIKPQEILTANKSRNWLQEASTAAIRRAIHHTHGENKLVGEF